MLIISTNHQSSNAPWGTLWSSTGLPLATSQVYIERCHYKINCFNISGRGRLKYPRNTTRTCGFGFKERYLKPIASSPKHGWLQILVVLLIIGINQATLYAGRTNQSSTEKFSMQADVIEASTLYQIHDLIFLLGGCLAGFWAGSCLGIWNRGLLQNQRPRSRSINQDIIQELSEVGVTLTGSP